MGLTQTTAPATEPVTVQEAKDFCRITHDDENSFILAMIRDGREFVENHTQRQLMSASWTWTLDAFPSLDANGIPTNRLVYDADLGLIVPIVPATSVTSISYIDEDGASQTLATTVYAIDTSREPARIYLKYDQEWPETRTIANAVTIIFVAGYANALSVPETLKTRIKEYVHHAYSMRGASGGDFNGAVDRIRQALTPYRMVTV